MMNNYIIIFITLIILILITIFRNYLLKKRRYKINNALKANYFLETLNKVIYDNKYNLLEERIRLKDIDAYGNDRFIMCLSGILTSFTWRWR